MPLLVEDDARNAVGFDSSTASTLFWKPVPVFLRQQEREDQQEELTFRILNGVARQNHNLRILRITLSSESDLTFLHTLEVSEEDFQSLKNEQGILVDFASFPGKIISLLEKCIALQPADGSPRFQSVLTVRGGESLFRIVETNDFKQLPHITLAFRPGNDTPVKQFLAFRLGEVKANCSDVQGDLSRTKDERDSLSESLASCRAQLSALREAHERGLLEVQAAAKTQAAEAHEERAREKAALKDLHERERADIEKRSREQLAAVNARVAELDAENRKLREAKYELDSKVSELSHKLGAAEGAKRALDDEGTRLKAAHTALAAAKHEQDIALNEAKAKVLALEEKTASQADVIEQARSRLKDLEAAQRQLESRCADLRDASAAADTRAKDTQTEVLKGNAIIEKLSNDLKMGKEKVKRKVAIIQRQEEELQQREASLSAALRDVQSLSQAADALKMEVSGLRGENGELRSKLEDSKQQLQSNEQMIRWLNQQVTEAQLQGSGSVPGSRYSFRPALTAGPGQQGSSSATTSGLSLGLLPSSMAAAAAPGTAPSSAYVSKYSSSLSMGLGSIPPGALSTAANLSIGSTLGVGGGAGGMGYPTSSAFKPGMSYSQGLSGQGYGSSMLHASPGGHMATPAVGMHSRQGAGSGGASSYHHHQQQQQGDAAAAGRDQGPPTTSTFGSSSVYGGGGDTTTPAPSRHYGGGGAGGAAGPPGITPAGMAGGLGMSSSFYGSGSVGLASAGAGGEGSVGSGGGFGSLSGGQGMR